MIKVIYLAGGCFWGLERYFSLVPGVEETRVGYANGSTANPSYEEVCAGSGHAETVAIRYRSEAVSLEELLELFYRVIDPTAINRQGPDRGVQYRTGIFYEDPEDRKPILRSLERLQRRYHKPLAVEVKPLARFDPAEAYHQRYLERNPGGYCHIPPEAFDWARRGAGRYRRQTPEELRERLTDLQYRVTQQGETEQPFSSPYCRAEREGIYVDVTTGEPLFATTDQFDSGCGWPSFAKPIQGAAMVKVPDHSHGMTRTEVRSSAGDAHLGHVFHDGPPVLGGQRYCINGAALRFIPREELAAEGYGKYVEIFT
jgi:peptide methionine sulfoxide reductase msrA/msrB